MSSNTSPPRKRARVDDVDGKDDAPVESDDIQRDEDVWFLDGNIVLIAKKTVAFRVYKGVLSLRSEIFRDMFSIPNANATATETFDGCPAFEVDESPEDIRHLFSVIFCGKNHYYNQGALVPVPFAILSSLIRMAHKYMVQDVLNDALSRLKMYYTTDLSAWQNPTARSRYVKTKQQDAPTVIQLARLTDALSLLPTAFLTCVSLSTKYRTKPDGSIEYPAAALAFPDLARVIAAKGNLAQATGTRALVLLGAVPSLRCTAREACGFAREEPLAALQENGLVPPIGDDDAFAPIAERLWDAPTWGAFCGSCRQALRKADAKEMKALWNDLPSQFGIRLEGDSWPRSSLSGDGEGQGA